MRVVPQPRRSKTRQSELGWSAAESASTHQAAALSACSAHVFFFTDFRWGLCARSTSATSARHTCTTTPPFLDDSDEAQPELAPVRDEGSSGSRQDWRNRWHTSSGDGAEGTNIEHTVPNDVEAQVRLLQHARLGLSSMRRGCPQPQASSCIVLTYTHAERSRPVLTGGTALLPPDFVA